MAGKSGSASMIIARMERGANMDEVRNILRMRPTEPRKNNSVGGPQFDQATVQRDAQETRIIVHARYPQLVQDFLAHKRHFGSTIEKAFYSSEGWTWQKQVARLGGFVPRFLSAKRNSFIIPPLPSTRYD